MKVFRIADSSRSGWSRFLILAAVIAALPGLVVAVALLWPSNVRFEVAGGGLTVLGSSYGRAWPAAELKADQARRLSAADDPAFHARIRTNGVGLPGYQAGWFTLHNGASAMLFASDWSRAVLVPTTTGDPLIVTPDDPDGLVSALTTPGPSASRTFPLAPSAGSGPLPWLALIIGPLLVVGLLAWLARSARKIRFELTDDALRIAGVPFYGRTIPRAALKPREGSVFDLARHETFGRMIRLNGIGLPNYLAGWFRPKGGGRALLFVTDTSRVVAIPTTEGYTLIASAGEPEAFLRELQQPA